MDQKACLQLIYETGQRPERQIATLGLVPRQTAESREQVTESFYVPEGFLNWTALESQPPKSVPRWVRLVIERNIDEMCQKRNPQPRTKCENLCLRSVETTRLLRWIALFDEKYDLTDADAQEATVRASRSANPAIIIVGIPRKASKSHLGFCMTLCGWQHERCALYIMILTDSEETSRMHFPRSSSWSLRHCTGAKGVPGSDGISDKSAGWTPTFLPWTVPACGPIHSRWQNTFNKSDCQRRTVAQRRALPSAGDSDRRRSLQPRKAICAEIARHGR